MATGRRAVVGAAIVREGLVLAARRTWPAAAAGRWEFPGGKVEPDETPEVALCRELHEELAVVARVDRWLAGTVPIDDTHELTVALVSIDGEPRPVDHDALRWLDAATLDDVDWLTPDVPFLAELRVILA